jgi:MoaA/NifB/PqqE/SkfB family radical SAM enzyme
MSTKKLVTLNKSINLDLTNKCSLKCPGCARQSFYEGKNIPGCDIDIESWEKITDYFDKILLCGQVSDPTFHNDFFNLLKIAMRKNVSLVISVAASFRPQSWFTRAFLMTKDHDVEWIFGIDGLPADSSKYRVNQDGEKLFNIMKRCASMGNKTTWQYIVFNYNEKDIDTCMSMAKAMNIKFKKIISSRWVNIEYLKPESEHNYLTRDF